MSENKVGRPKGRNPENWKRKTIFSTTTISANPEEMIKLKELAKRNKKSLSRFIIEKLLYTES